MSTRSRLADPERLDTVPSTGRRHASVIVGAYAAARPDLASDPDAEADWYHTLRSDSAIGGLELAFDETLHRAGMQHLSTLLHRDWQSVVTCIPGTGRILPTTSSYGLASINSYGRARAIEDLRTVHAEVSELQAVLGDGAIVAVQLPSAPNTQTAGSSVERFTESLTEIASWSWRGATIMVEHCDSAGSAHPAQKGYLRLEDEIDAVRAANAALSSSASRETKVGHAINWARSTIESRDAATPLLHVDRLRRAGAPTALIFSGVSPVRTRFGDKWVDAHLPARGHDSTGTGTGTDAEASSLLTSRAIRDALENSGPLLYTGVKVGAGTNSPDADVRLAPTLATRDQVLAESCAFMAGR